MRRTACNERRACGRRLELVLEHQQAYEAKLRLCRFSQQLSDIGSAQLLRRERANAASDHAVALVGVGHHLSRANEGADIAHAGYEIAGKRHR